MPFQELKQLVLRMGQEARAHQRAREHEAERLRIEIVTLREALEEETATRASLEGQLRVQREETGEWRDELPLSCSRRGGGGGGLASPQGTTWVPGGERDGARTSLDLSLFPSHTEVLEGEYSWSRAGLGLGLVNESMGLTACLCLTS